MTERKPKRERLRLPDVQDQMRAAQLEEVRKKIQVGLDQLDRGEGVTLNGDKELKQFFEDIKAKGRERLNKSRGQPA